MMLLPTDLDLLLATLARLPQDRPFTTREADALGTDSHVRTRLLIEGFLVRPIRGVYHSPSLVDTLALRIAILKLAVPRDCVVTDRTAAWLWGVAMALAPGDHLTPPRVSVFAPPGRRLRNDLTASGERGLAPGDVVEIDGLLVTTPLRTACDLARLLPAAYALGTVDLIAQTAGFAADELIEELGRFKGYRGIIQARLIAPLIDPRSQSIMEGVTRYYWHGAGLPWPECQCEVEAPRGSYFIDIGLPDEKFGAEYDGEEFHTEDDAPHDDGRRTWARDVLGWGIVVARKVNVIGRHRNIESLLRQRWAQHRS